MIKTEIVDIHKINGKRPNFDIYIGRATRYTEFTKNSKWANPFRVRDEFCLQNYYRYIWNKITTNPDYNIKELIGKKLGCWCLNTDRIPESVNDCRCHGEVLLIIMKELGFIE